MENPFNLSDEKLKKILDGYFVWTNKKEKDKKYPGSEIKRRRGSGLEMTYFSLMPACS